MVTFDDVFGTEYTFEKLHNTTCTPRGDEKFTDLEEAKNICKKRSPCKGVLEDIKDGQTKYYLCSIPAQTRSDELVMSCFYQKDSVGKQSR